MQSLQPVKAEESGQHREPLQGISCHVSKAPAKSKHVVPNGVLLDVKKPHTPGLTQSAEKPIQILLKKPEIPACIEACDIGSLLDKFLEYEVNQSVNVGMIKSSSVVLTPVSSPCHKNTRHFIDPFGGNNKSMNVKAMEMTPPVSPPSCPVEDHSSTPKTSQQLTDKQTSRSKGTLPHPSEKPVLMRHALTRNQNGAGEPVSNSEKACKKEASLETCANQSTANNVEFEKSEIVHSASTRNSSTTKHQENTEEVTRKLTNLKETSSTDVIKTVKTDTQTSTKPHFSQERKSKLQCESASEINVGANDEIDRKRQYSPVDDDDKDFKRKKYMHGTKDECYWSTSEEETDGKSKRFSSSKREKKREKRHSSRRRCDSAESDKETRHKRKDRHSTHRSHHKQEKRHRQRHEIEKKDLSCQEQGHVYDVEKERKKIFKLDRGFDETSTEKRRIVYIGNIDRTMSKSDVWRRFREYGPIEKTTVHYRDDGDNYSFVTFVEPSGALEAIEKAKLDPKLNHLDICFGGRRKFCGGSYVDFDSNTSYLEEKEMDEGVKHTAANEEMDFDALLKMCQKKKTRC